MSCPARWAMGPSWPQPVIRRVDEPRIAGQHLVGTEAEPLQDAGPETLDQHVGVVEQAEQDLPALRRLEVDGDARPAAVERVLLLRHEQSGAARPVHAHEVRTQFGEQHAGVGAGPRPASSTTRSPVNGPEGGCTREP